MLCVPGWLKSGETQEVRNPWSSRVWRSLSSGTLTKGWSSWIKLRRSRRSQVKYVTSKVWVRGVNWWQTCNCMKLAPQITRCKRHSCTCSHWEYSLDLRVISECKSPFVSLLKGHEGACKGVHNFWGEYRLLGIPCLPSLCDSHALILDSCVRGLHPIFGPQHSLVL
jgi:hypothetical protein